jgi:hypothetical protein
MQTLEIAVACSHCGKLVKRNACRANMPATCFDCRVEMQKVAQDRRGAQGIPAKRREPLLHGNEARR